MSSEKPVHILLALDAAADDAGPLASLATAITAEVPGRGARIEPIYVIHADSLTLLDFVESNFASYKENLLAKLRKAVEKLDLPGLMPPTLLMAGSVTRQGCVNELLRYARTTEADMIALSTQAKSGARRWLTGSFAETLMATSTLPLLIVNPHDTWIRKKIRTILYPTDLSTASKEGLNLLVRQLSEYVEGKQIRLVLFHQLDIVPFLYGPYPGVPTPQASLDNDYAKRKDTGHEWALELREKGLEARFTIRRRYLPPADAIVYQARRMGADLIALISHSSAIQGTLFGSTARQVLRKASCPVWVVHAQDSKPARHQKGSDEARVA